MEEKQLAYTFSEVWNKSLEEGEPRKMSPRDRIWASEMGNAMVDTYLKMTGVQPSNPPNPRSLRKFEAGNLMENIIAMVLKRAGILLDQQEWVGHQYPGMFLVSGKLDFMIGGKPDFEKAEAEIKSLTELGILPDSIIRGTMKIKDYFKAKFGEGLFQSELKPLVLEVKSCSGQMFDFYERYGHGSMNHHLQAFHYLKAKNMDEAHILYASKDDLRLLEIGVFNPSAIEDEYKRIIETITYYVRSKKQPPLEKELVFDKEFFKFSKNWKVAYSNYLTMLYGYENQKKFDDIFTKVQQKYTRVYNRCVKGDKMTKLNLEMIKEIKLKFPDFDDLVEMKRVYLKDHPEDIAEEEEVTT